MDTIYWTLLKKDHWKLYIAATTNGLCYVGSLGQSFDELIHWANKRNPKVKLVENNALMEQYIHEIDDFLEGKRQEFTIPMDYKGTSFQVAVWEALCSIPYGETKTYSEIAGMINKPKAVRAVGTAIGANPLLITIPCHRVIGKDGSLTGYRGGLEMKTNLLKMESQYV